MCRWCGGGGGASGRGGAGPGIGADPVGAGVPAKADDGCLNSRPTASLIFSFATARFSTFEIGLGFEAFTSRAARCATRDPSTVPLCRTQGGELYSMLLRAGISGTNPAARRHTCKATHSLLHVHLALPPLGEQSRRRSNFGSGKLPPRWLLKCPCRAVLFFLWCEVIVPILPALQRS